MPDEIDVLILLIGRMDSILQKMDKIIDLIEDMKLILGAKGL